LLSALFERHRRRPAFLLRVNNREAKGGEGMTQFGRALHELNIDIICVGNPWATRGPHVGWMLYGIAVLAIIYGLSGQWTAATASHRSASPLKSATVTELPRPP
jgi:hypothetical protein